MQASLALSSACSCCTCAFCYFSCAFSFRNIFFLFLPFFSRCYCYCCMRFCLLFSISITTPAPTLLSALPLSPLPQRYCALQQASRKASKNVSLIREVSCFECPQLVGSTRLPSFLPLFLAFSLSLSLSLCFAAAVPVCVGDVVKSFICR